MQQTFIMIKPEGVHKLPFPSSYIHVHFNSEFGCVYDKLRLYMLVIGESMCRFER